MKKLLFFFILTFVVSLLLTGCAKKVTGNTTNPTLVVNVTFAGAVDITTYRYFLILNRDPTHATGPDLITDGKNRGWELPFDGAPAAGLGYLNAANAPNFKYTDFYELSIDRGVTHGTVASGFVSSTDPTVSITASGVNVTFSIPLDPLVPFYQIQVVSTNNATSPNNYVIADFLDSGTDWTGYHWLPTTRGYSYSAPVNAGGGLIPPVPAPADIINWSVLII